MKIIDINGKEYTIEPDANLSGANLWRTKLNDARLQGANLSDANLSDAKLSGAELNGANLSEANLTNIEYDDETIWPEGFKPPMS